MTQPVPEFIKLTIRSDLLFGIMNVLDTTMADTIQGVLDENEVHPQTTEAAIQGFDDLVDAVEEAYGESCWVDFGVAG